MRTKRTRLVTLAAIAVVLLCLSTHIHVAYLTALVLVELGSPEVDGPIAARRPDPIVERVSFDAYGTTMVADLYRPPDDKRHPGIILSHGVAYRGKDDPRLVNFADALARVGYVALVPDFVNLKEFRVRPSDIDEFVCSFEYLEEYARIRPDRIGLFGFSYAGGLAVLSASDPRIADRVRFCFLLGGYYDLENVITYMTTGMYERDGERVYLEPRNSGRWAFLLNSADLIEDEADRETLMRVSRLKMDDPDHDVSALVATLGQEGTRAYALMVNDDPDSTRGLIEGLSERVQEYFSDLTLEGRIDGLRARLIVGHGKDDDLIPYTESLLLAENVPPGTPIHLEILESFHHVDITLGEGEGITAFFASVVEAWRLFSITYDLLAQGLL
jgi:acetyl esterase/lipase